MLAISLVLAFSFGGYGLVRKLTPVESLPGLTIETALLFLPAVGIVAWHAQAPAGIALGNSASTDTLLALSGVVTATPLLLFAAAARRLDYSVLGFCQYLAPTIVFLLGLFVFHEPLRPVQLASFVLIWVAIAVFSIDMAHRSHAARRARG
jgi:chloramphenicol-sensitive protein RarD